MTLPLTQHLFSCLGGPAKLGSGSGAKRHLSGHLHFVWGLCSPDRSCKRAGAAQHPCSGLQASFSVALSQVSPRGQVPDHGV